MALDAQRNWTISMAENLERVTRSGNTNTLSQDTQRDQADMSPTTSTTQHLGTPIYLPSEILVQILEYTAHHPHPHAQRTLASTCLLSKQWYEAAVPFLYAHPHLYGKNFDPFVRAICPSINLHVRKSPLSQLVKVLDMSNLVHQARKSLTARLLGRTKGSLEVFVAPQASFAVVCFPPLAKCGKLRTLDLSLVSESPPLPELFKTVAHLEELRTFRLPRSAGFGVHHKPAAFTWPPNLEDLSLSGGVDGHFMHGVVAFPQSLRSLTIEHCPSLKAHAVNHLLRTAVRPLRNLESLTIRNMPRLSSHALDDVLLLFPHIQRLSLSVDYITPALFDEAHFNHSGAVKVPTNISMDLDDWAAISGNIVPGTTETQAQETLQHNSLTMLELTNSGNPGVEDKISPIDIMIAIDEGTLPKLRQVRVAKSLLWHSSNTASDAEALADVLTEASRRDWEAGEGAWTGKGRGNEKIREMRDGKREWERVAGVWMFDG